MWVIIWFINHLILCTKIFLCLFMRVWYEFEIWAKKSVENNFKVMIYVLFFRHGFRFFLHLFINLSLLFLESLLFFLYSSSLWHNNQAKAKKCVCVFLCVCVFVRVCVCVCVNVVFPAITIRTHYLR
jgi:hypothetical protein